MRRALSWLRGALGHNDRGVAFREEDRTVRAAMKRPGVDPRFHDAMRAAARQRSVLLGQAAHSPTLDVRLTRADLLTHALVLGATGSGKTRLVSSVVMFLLREIARAPDELGLVLCDFKGEFVDLVRELAFDLIEDLPDHEAQRLLDRWVVFDPFSTTSLLPMQLLLRDPTVPPEIQAAELTSVVERMGGAPLGVKQDAHVYALLLFGILEGLDMLDLRRLLADLPALEARARASSSTEVREALGSATKLQKASLEGVRARLDKILRLPSMRLMLGAKSCASFRDILNSKILVADVGSPPLGCGDLGAFWSAFLMLKVTRSIFERTQVDTTRPVVVVADEWQQGLLAGGDVVEQFENVLATARSRAVHLWMISQSMTGAAKVSSSLPEVVATNTTLQLLGRAAIKDARLMSHMLPVTGRYPRPKASPWDAPTRSPFLTAAEERERLIERVPHQEARSFYLWDRRQPYRAELLRAATIEPTSVHFRSASAGQRLKDGALAVRITELEKARRDDATAGFDGGCLVQALLGPKRRPTPDT